MSSTFIHAVSPSLRAITTIINKSSNNGTPTLAYSARHASYMGVSSTNELIELIPSDYRSILTTPLHALVSLVIKLAGVWTMLATYWCHQVDGTFPLNIRSTAPIVQLTSEFAGTNEAHAAQRALDTTLMEFQQSSLKAMVKAKEDEEHSLVSELSLTTL